MPKYIIARFAFGNGYASDLPATAGGGFMRRGSANAMVTGSGLIRPFNGLTELYRKVAGEVNFLTDNSYAGLSTDGVSYGKGSVFEALDLLFYIGQGRLSVGGQYVINPADGEQVEASSNFSYLKRDGSTFYNGGPAYALQVGHARPSSPNVYAKSPPSSGKTPMNAAVSVVIWRADTNTGQPSLASIPSQVLSLSNSSMIVQFPAADANGQDVWGIGVPLLGLRDLGNFYALPTTMGGEVTEAALTASRTITQVSITNGDKTATIVSGGTFTSADIGRRISFGTYDSWITSINPGGTSCECYDAAGSTVTNQLATVTHAVDGITRAVEISWADTDLFGQTLAPFDAFEPPDGLFAGAMFDTFYIEAVDGTIYYSIPNYMSFPRSRKIFTQDVATCYVQSGSGYHWRIAKQSISKMYYVGGLAPIQVDEVIPNMGCKYQTNACLGYGERLLVWTGSPLMVYPNGGADAAFYLPVELEFKDWDQQTQVTPVVVGYDPKGKYEIWGYDQKVMAYHAPSGRWCAPIDLSDWLEVGEKLVGTVIIDESLCLVTRTAAVAGMADVDRKLTETATITNGSNEVVISDAGALTNADIGMFMAVMVNGVYKYGGEITAYVDDLTTTTVTLGDEPNYAGGNLSGCDVYIYSKGDVMRVYQWNVGSGSDMTLMSYHEDCESETAVLVQTDTIAKPGDVATQFTITAVKDFYKETELGVFTAETTPETQVLSCSRQQVRGIQTLGIRVDVTGSSPGTKANGYAAVDTVICYGEIGKAFARTPTNT